MSQERQRTLDRLRSLKQVTTYHKHQHHMFQPLLKRNPPPHRSTTSKPYFIGKCLAYFKVLNVVVVTSLFSSQHMVQSAVIMIWRSKNMCNFTRSSSTSLGADSFFLASSPPALSRPGDCEVKPPAPESDSQSEACRAAARHPGCQRSDRLHLRSPRTLRSSPARSLQL